MASRKLNAFKWTVANWSASRRTSSGPLVGRVSAAHFARSKMRATIMLAGRAEAGDR